VLSHRVILAADARSGGVVIISDRLWRERFASAPTVIGQSIRLDTRAYIVVGVMPERFWFPYRSGDVWLPLGGAPHDAQDQLGVVGRLRPERTWADARAELDVLAETRTLLRSLPDEAAIRFGPAMQGFVAPAIAILLIACANAAGLLIMTLASREKELGIRASLGATPAQLARLALAEALLVGATAAAAGTIAAAWSVRALQLAVSASIPALPDLTQSGGRFIAVAAAAATVTLAVTALLPAIWILRADIAGSLAGRLARPISRHLRYGVADLLVVLQVALAVALVMTCVFQVRFFDYLVRVGRPPGAERTLVARLTTADDMPPAARSLALDRLLESANAAPGLGAAALTTTLPAVRGQRPTRLAVTSSIGTKECSAQVAQVSERFFEAAGIALLGGSARGANDGAAVVVSETVARTCLQGTDTGWHVRRADNGSAGTWVPVTGVARDPVVSRPDWLAGSTAYVWFVSPPEWPSTLFVVATPSIDSRAAAAGLREALGRVSESVASERVSTVEEHLAAELAAPLVIVRLLGVVALVALTLAFLGAHAAISQSCTRRLTELGVRLAIGAAPRQLAVLALQRDGPLVAAGIVAGAGAMVWVTAIVWRDLLWLGAGDPATWATIAATIGAAAALASLGPALRAARVDPAVLLRAE